MQGGGGGCPGSSLEFFWEVAGYKQMKGLVVSEPHGRPGQPELVVGAGDGAAVPTGWWPSLSSLCSGARLGHGLL